MALKVYLGALVAATLLVAGCASRHSVAAHQQPEPLAVQAFEADPASPYAGQMALGAVTGISEFSWFLPEPNRRVFRPRFEAALAASGLSAPDRDQARYVINVHFSDSGGPVIGSHLDAFLVGQVEVVDRLHGRIIFAEPIQAHRHARWPGLTERDWATNGWFEVFNILPFFFDSPWLTVGPRFDTTYPPFAGPEWAPLVPITTRRSDGRLIYADNGQVFGPRSGASRAWQVNAAVTDAVSAAFIRGFARSTGLVISRVLPCDGGDEIETYKIDLMRRGESFVTGPCPALLAVQGAGARSLARR